MGMASHIKKGESIFIPFRNGKSIADSQLKPRMYKTMQAFQKAFPGHYLGTKDVELVEYAEVVRCRDCIFAEPNDASDEYVDCRQLFGMAVRKDWYCADGERKDDEH